MIERPKGVIVITLQHSRLLLAKPFVSQTLAPMDVYPRTVPFPLYSLTLGQMNVAKQNVFYVTDLLFSNDSHATLLNSFDAHALSQPFIPHGHVASSRSWACRAARMRPSADKYRNEGHAQLHEVLDAPPSTNFRRSGKRRVLVGQTLSHRRRETLAQKSARGLFA